ncbi:hypothetical protein [Zooshikella ganghwensis]|uniref:Uncharacterized protein n=1 Tax=Zooshikella ganghwensis TaxID=202772 RepID=A0A4P9VMU5_9GAMM|nr:hypothetical protein [Zooshikella ganghwensis]RDH43717.1 hypothetical protein B9G39_09840 [Zooshikella ganghwensis]
MKKFEFEIDSVFNMTAQKGVVRAFAGKVRDGSVQEGDHVVLEADDNVFHLTVEGCEIFRKKLEYLTPESGMCGILARIEPEVEFRELQQERGLDYLRGKKIRND